MNKSELSKQELIEETLLERVTGGANAIVDDEDCIPMLCEPGLCICMTN
ncbi:hypothetical protein L2725_14665 [Shewanella corallii]|uniref:Bacteriocin n=1 Tax=Shewanella corallii TaxID=560080 RepID=A0ABT0N9F3_9GAMM|nr:hypothetical protein [Shewanella corallii]MCL2915000.1 hypothetical protein [Shewanella corallii]